MRGSSWMEHASSKLNAASSTGSEKEEYRSSISCASCLFVGNEEESLTTFPGAAAAAPSDAY